MGGGFRLDVSVDLSPALARLEGPGAADALEALTREIEADIRPYVKRDTGTLEQSAELASDFRAGRVEWTAVDEHGEYASYAYYDKNVGAHEGQNPKATSHWIEAAKAVLMGSWTRRAGELFAGKG